MDDFMITACSFVTYAGKPVLMVQWAGSQVWESYSLA